MKRGVKRGEERRGEERRGVAGGPWEVSNTRMWSRAPLRPGPGEWARTV